MQTLVERGCGLDVHQATVVACLLHVMRDGRVEKQLRSFGTTTRELVSMREWLLSEGCTQVAMESTGVYWKPVLSGSTPMMKVANWSESTAAERRRATFASCGIEFLWS